MFRIQKGWDPDLRVSSFFGMGDTSGTQTAEIWYNVVRHYTRQVRISQRDTISQIWYNRRRVGIMPLHRRQFHVRLLNSYKKIYLECQTMENHKNEPAYMRVYRELKSEIQKGTYPAR